MKEKVESGLLYSAMGLIVLVVSIAIYNAMTSFVSDVVTPALRGQFIFFVFYINNDFDVWFTIAVVGFAVIIALAIVFGDKVVKAIKNRG